MCGNHDATLDINMSDNIHSESLTFKRFQSSLRHNLFEIKRIVIFSDNKTKRRKL